MENLPSLQVRMGQVCPQAKEVTFTSTPRFKEARQVWALNQLSPLHQLTVLPAFEADKIVKVVEQCAQHVRKMGFIPWLATEMRSNLLELKDGLKHNSAVEDSLTTTEMRTFGDKFKDVVWIMPLGEHFRENELQHMLTTNPAPMILMPHPPFNLLQRNEGFWLHTQRLMVEARMQADFRGTNLERRLPTPPETSVETRLSAPKPRM